MKEDPLLNATTLLKEAENSEHQEAYRTLEKTLNYRISVGARLTPPNPPYFFIEILIYLSIDDGKVDLRVLEKSLSCLRELQARRFKTVFQDGNCIACEEQVSKEKLKPEYERAKSLIAKIFDT